MYLKRCNEFDKQNWLKVCSNFNLYLNMLHSRHWDTCETRSLYKYKELFENNINFAVESVASNVFYVPVPVPVQCYYFKSNNHMCISSDLTIRKPMVYITSSNKHSQRQPNKPFPYGLFVRNILWALSNHTIDLTLY